MMNNCLTRGDRHLLPGDPRVPEVLVYWQHDRQLKYGRIWLRNCMHGWMATSEDMMRADTSGPYRYKDTRAAAARRSNQRKAPDRQIPTYKQVSPA